MLLDFVKNIAANIVAAVLIGAAIAAWAVVKNLPGPTVAVLALVAFSTTLWIISQLESRGWWFRRRLSPMKAVPKGIAYLRGISLIYQGGEIQVDCSVAFYGVSGAKESPTEMILRTADNNSQELCLLKLPRAPQVVESGEWGFIPYRASIRIEQRTIVLQAIRQTMRTLPMKGSVFLKVAVDLPVGHARQSYAESGVQYDVPPHVGDRAPVVVQIANWDGVPMAWAFDELWSLSEDDKARIREHQPDVWEKFIQEVQGRGLSYSGRPETIYKVVMPDGTIRRFAYDEIADLPLEQQQKLFDAHPDLKQWWDRETSDRMGPPGRPGAPWPEDLDDSSWTYQEMSGRAWRYRDICSLPIPERQKLKAEKPDVWRAYWDETLRRPQYVLPDGRRLTKSDIAAMNTMELLQLGGADPDAIDWYTKGQKF